MLIFLIGSIVSYTRYSKKNILQISESELDNYSTVSQEITVKMAESVKEKFNTDYWADTYSTPWLCVQNITVDEVSYPYSIQEPEEMHKACRKDNNTAADAMCRAEGQTLANFEAHGETKKFLQFY